MTYSTNGMFVLTYSTNGMFVITYCTDGMLTLQSHGGSDLHLLRILQTIENSRCSINYKLDTLSRSGPFPFPS